MTVNVLDFGTPEREELCTEIIQKAIDRCFLNGGGEVVIPRGVYKVGSLRLRSGITLHLMEDAILEGSLDPRDYDGYINDKIEPIPEELREKVVDTALEGATGRSVIPFSKWNNAIIRAYEAENIAIIGERGSEINGGNCFDEEGEEKYRGPHGINFWFCKNVLLKGYTVRDSANWAHAIQNSSDIKISGVTVLGGHDGFDVRTCDRVRVEDCIFRTGDDCIAGFDNYDVVIRNCIFDCACSMLRFGGNKVLVEDCKGYAAPSTYGFRGSLTEEERRMRAPTHEKCRRTSHNAFLYYCDNRAKVRRTPGNIVFKNCEFNRPNAILNHPFGHKWCCNRPLKDVTFEGCSFFGLSMPSKLTCPEGEPLKLTLRNCVATPKEGFEDIALIFAEGGCEIILEDLKLCGFKDPRIEGEDSKITVRGGSKIRF